MSRAFLVVLMSAASSCSEDAAAPTECNLPADPRFAFTKVDLDADRSNAKCPMIEATALDTDALAEQGACEQAIVDCMIVLTCDYEGLSIRGRLVESDEGLSGEFDIETPFACVYSVNAKWKEVDGG